MKIFVTMPDGATKTLEGTAGWQVMEIIKAAGIPIRAECGGACACATCHVYIDPAWVPKIPKAKPEEIDMLDMAMVVKDNSRLSCQVIFTPELDGLKLTIAPDSL